MCECVRNLGGELELAVSLEDLAQLAPLRLKHALRLSLSIFISLSLSPCLCLCLCLCLSVSLSLCLPVSLARSHSAGRSLPVHILRPLTTILIRKCSLDLIKSLIKTDQDKYLMRSSFAQCSLASARHLRR